MAHPCELVAYVGKSKSVKPSREARVVSEVSKPHLARLA